MRIQTPMAQGRSTKFISTIKWIRTSRLSITNALSGEPVAFYCLNQELATFGKHIRSFGTIVTQEDSSEREFFADNLLVRIYSVI